MLPTDLARPEMRHTWLNMHAYDDCEGENLCLGQGMLGGFELLLESNALALCLLRLLLVGISRFQTLGLGCSLLNVF